MRDEKPTVKLTGRDGNAYMIIGLCQRAARKANWTDEQWLKIRAEMMSGDYDHVLQTAMRYFEVE